MGSTSSKHKKPGKHGIRYQQTPTSAVKPSSVFPLNPVPHLSPTLPKHMSRDKSVFVHTPGTYNRALHPPHPTHGPQSTPVYPQNVPVIPQSNAGSAGGKYERRGGMKVYPRANSASGSQAERAAPPVIPYQSAHYATTPSVTPAAFPPPPIIEDQNAYASKRMRVATPFARPHDVPPPSEFSASSDSGSDSESESSSSSSEDYGHVRAPSRNAATPRFAVPPLQQNTHSNYSTPYPPQPPAMSMPSPSPQPPPMPVPNVVPPSNPPPHPSEPQAPPLNSNGPIHPMTPAQSHAYGPQHGSHRAPLKNPLPPPPRDLYEMAPFNALREMSETTKFILLGQEHAMKAGRDMTEANTLVPGLLDYLYSTDGKKKEEKKKGLFHSLSTRTKKDTGPKIVPVFVPTGSSGRRHSVDHPPEPPRQPPVIPVPAPSTSSGSSIQNQPPPMVTAPHLSQSPMAFPQANLPNAHSGPVRPPSRTASAHSKTTHRSGFSVEMPHRNKHRDSGSSTRSSSSTIIQPNMSMPEPHAAASVDLGRPAPLPIPFSHTTPYASFLNHSPHRVMFQNKTYPTATHLFEALKFLPEHPEVADKIVNCQDPVQAVFISAQAEHKKLARPDWKRIYLKVMQDVLWRKFQQHPKLRNMLLNTGDAELIYADEGDGFWGRGPTGDGKNELGKALMHTRTMLRLHGTNPEGR